MRIKLNETVWISTVDQVGRPRTPIGLCTENIANDMGLVPQSAQRKSQMANTILCGRNFTNKNLGTGWAATSQCMQRKVGGQSNTQ